jgi:hypothetical protein
VLSLVAAGVLPVLAVGSFNRHIDELDLGGQRLVSDAWVINDAGTYKMWFTHLSSEVTPSQLVGRVSGLGLHAIFTALQNHDIEALLQHISGLDAQAVYDLFKDSAGVIGYATSHDGLTWDVIDDEVLSAANEIQMVAAPCVIKVDATYHMWYTRTTIDFTLLELEGLLTDLGIPAQRLTAITELMNGMATVVDYATSVDGVSWVVQVEGVVEGAGVYYGDSAAAPNVIWDGTSFQMWFNNLSTGITPTLLEDMLDNISSLSAADLWQLQAGATASIGHATSTNGINWTGLDRSVFSAGGGVLNSVITPCVLYDGASYEMWYSYGISSLTQDDISPIINELSQIDITSLMALFEAEDYTGLITELTQIINEEIPETKARLTGTGTVIGYATSSDGLSWDVKPVALAGETLAPWSSVARPCVIKSGVAYEMWFTKGIDELNAQNLVDLWQGTIGTIGYASFSNLGAETTSAVAQDGDDVVVVNMLIHRVKDVTSGETELIPGGMTGYNAILSADLAGVELVTVRGGALFPTPTVVGLTFSCHDISSPMQPDDTVTAKVVLRLVGDCLTPYTVTLSYEAIRAADPPGLSITEDESFTYTFLRGDATGDGVVNILDALIIAQYRAGIVQLSDLKGVNAACVVHDGIPGDKINILDALAIAQNRALILDEYFNPN